MYISIFYKKKIPPLKEVVIFAMKLKRIIIFFILYVHKMLFGFFLIIYSMLSISFPRLLQYLGIKRAEILDI
jgi:hypothetical protein